MGFEIKLTDNSAEILAELEKSKAAALEAVGQQAVSNTKNYIKSISLIDTGRLRNSIAYTTKATPATTIQFKQGKKGELITDSEFQVQISDEDKVIIGTAVYYAPFQEYGTKRGVKPKHFLRNAIANHQKEYIEIIKKYLKGNS